MTETTPMIFQAVRMALHVMHLLQLQMRIYFRTLESTLQPEIKSKPSIIQIFHNVYVQLLMHAIQSVSALPVALRTKLDMVRLFRVPFL